MSSIGRISSEKRPRADGHFIIVDTSAMVVPAPTVVGEFLQKLTTMNTRGVV
jgi:hypothetical protein